MSVINVVSYVLYTKPNPDVSSTVIAVSVSPVLDSLYDLYIYIYTHTYMCLQPGPSPVILPGRLVLDLNILCRVYLETIAIDLSWNSSH